MLTKLGLIMMSGILASVHDSMMRFTKSVSDDCGHSSTATLSVGSNGSFCMFAVRTQGGTSDTSVPSFQSLLAKAAAPMSGKKIRIVRSGSSVSVSAVGVAAAAVSTVAVVDVVAAVFVASSVTATAVSGIDILRPISFDSIAENSLIMGNVFFRDVYVMSPIDVSKSIRTRICPDAIHAIERDADRPTASWNVLGSSVTSDDIGISSPMMDCVNLLASNPVLALNDHWVLW